MNWLLDLDGVVWLADQPIPGSREAIAELRTSARGVLFLTNNSYPRRDDHLAKLHHMGIECAPDELLTSSAAAASLLKEGERAFVIGGPGIREALGARGVEVVGANGTGKVDVAAVVVGMDPGFDYPMLTVALRALHEGARLIGTNDDATYPTPHGMVPGAGSILAAVAYASGLDAVVAGKPHSPMVEAVRQRFGAIAYVVGDRPSTDGLIAARLAAPFALVYSGVTPADHGPVEPVPALEGADLAAIVEQALHR